MKRIIKIMVCFLLLLIMLSGGFLFWNESESNKNIYNENYSKVLNKNRYNYIYDNYESLLDIITLIKTRAYDKNEIIEMVSNRNISSPILPENNSDAIKLNLTINKSLVSIRKMIIETDVENSLGIEYIFLDDVNEENFDIMSKYFNENSFDKLLIYEEDYKYLYNMCIAK